MTDQQPGRKSGGDTAVTVKAGQTLFRQGEPATHCFVIKRGQVELLRTVGADERRVALLAAGDLFGEAALLDNRACELGARVVSDATLLKVEGPAFAEVVRQRPEVGLLAIRRLAARAATECVQWAALVEAAPVPATPVREAPGGARPVAAASKPRLVHAESGTVFGLPERDEVLVGRADPRTKFEPDIDLSGVDTQRSLSRRHARITRAGRGFVIIEEPRVANHTFVNGKQLAPGDPTAIKSGDEVSFGLVRTIFRTD